MKQGNEEKKLRCECGYKLIDVGLFQLLIFSTGLLFRVFQQFWKKWHSYHLDTFYQSTFRWIWLNWPWDWMSILFYLFQRRPSFLRLIKSDTLSSAVSPIKLNRCWFSSWNSLDIFEKYYRKYSGISVNPNALLPIFYENRDYLWEFDDWSNCLKYW